MSRVAVLAACFGLLVAIRSGASPPVAAAPTTAPSRPVQYVAPLTDRLVVARGFEPPLTPYAAGHRGVDLRTSPRATVRSAGAGLVSFAGSIAGRGVVVIRHADGVVTEYEPLTVLVSAGGSVATGQPIGRLHGSHGDCPPDACLHWGGRRNGGYFDPLTLLRPLGPVHLVPWPTSP